MTIHPVTGQLKLPKVFQHTVHGKLKSVAGKLNPDQGNIKTGPGSITIPSVCIKPGLGTNYFHTGNH